LSRDAADRAVCGDQRSGAASPFARPGIADFKPSGPLGPVFAWVLNTQQALQQRLAGSVRALKTENPFAGAFSLALLSFLYGVVHAVGPGHGKTIISSYVVANEKTARRGIIVSFVAAALQAVTAIALVGIFVVLLNAPGVEIMAWSNQLETVSYAMIASVGLWLLVNQLIAIWRGWRGESSDAHHHHGHDHGHPGYAHAEEHHLTTMGSITVTPMPKAKPAITWSIRAHLRVRSPGER
jgi:nickel/cobalt exporter